MSTWVLSLLLAVALAGVVPLSYQARRAALAPATAALIAGGSALLLFLMVLSDWPTDLLSEFWAEHSVLAALLSTLLTVGFAFMAYQYFDLREEDRLHRQVAVAGIGGALEPVAAVRTALEMAGGETAPDAFTTIGRPLKWLDVRESRPGPVQNIALGEDDWRWDLVDQALRRLATTMRDWGPLIAMSRQGLTLLEEMGHLRLTLMSVLADGVGLVNACEEARRLEDRVHRHSRPAPDSHQS